MVLTEPDNFYLLLTFIKTCIMKKILLMLASAFFMFSCSQEEGTSPINENTSNLPVSATADAQLKFAKLLSQAASGSIEVRNFLKKEALVQFDNDYDIFYPLIKDKKVYTFSINRKEMEKENQIDEKDDDVIPISDSVETKKPNKTGFVLLLGLLTFVLVIDLIVMKNKKNKN